ncbi:hypothetical protein OSTOST_06265 [Ostertagia ostertagi]
MSVKNVAEIKLDIEKSVKREGTFDVVRKQGFAIVNSDGFLDSLQKKVAVISEHERLSKDDFRRMIRHHLRTKGTCRNHRKVTLTSGSQMVEKALMVDSVMEGKVSVDSFNFGPFVSSGGSDRDSSSDMIESDNSCSDMSVSDMASEISFVDVMN